MPYKVCTSTSPSEDRVETPSFQVQYVVNELSRWLEAAEEHQTNAASENRHRFTFQRVQMRVGVAEGIEVRESSWDVDCLCFPVTDPYKSYDLENMFAHAMDRFLKTGTEDQYVPREALKTLPETLLVKLYRQVPTDSAAPHPVIDTPVTFPDVIDFGKTDGFSMPLHVSCLRERYKLVGILMGRGNAGSQRWAYGFCAVKKCWGEVCLDVETNKGVFVEVLNTDAKVRRIMNGDTEQTGGYVLKLYYQQQPSLPSRLDAATKAVDHTQQFDTLAAVMNVSPKNCTRLLQHGPKYLPRVLTGYTVFEIHCIKVVPLKVGASWHGTSEELELLRKTIRNEWTHGLNSETKGLWMANAARCNQGYAKGLSPFVHVSPKEVFKEQWTLTMMCGEAGAETSLQRLMDPSNMWCEKNMNWLRKQSYFNQLWEGLHAEHRSWFVRMAKDRNCGVGISHEQGILEIWESYKFVLCSFLIPGSALWREAGAVLLRENSRAARAKLREHFIGVLPEWKKECNKVNGLARLRRSDNDALNEAMRTLGDTATTSRPTASVKVDADDEFVARSTVTKEVDVSWKSTGTDCRLFSKDRPELLNFKFECTMCKAGLGFTAPSTPGAQMTTQCHSCKGVLTVIIPDTRVMEAEAVLHRYVEVLRARQELKRLCARRDLCLKTIKNISKVRGGIVWYSLLKGFARSWRSFLPVLYELLKDPAFDPDKLNPTMVHLAMNCWLGAKTSLEAEEGKEQRLTVRFPRDDEQPAAHGSSLPPPLAREHARERLEPHVMSAPPPFDRRYARERPVPQMARRIDKVELEPLVARAEENELWDFIICCDACHKRFEFRSPYTVGENIKVTCHRCENVMTAKVPDARRLAAVSTISSYVLVIHARKKLHRLRKAAQARADAEARAARRAAEEAGQRAARAARDAEMFEQLRQEEERAAAARAAAAERQAAIEAAAAAREAERLEANRVAHADFLRRQEEDREARKQAARAEAEAAAPAVAAARQARKEQRATARATVRANKKWVDPFKAEKARREAHIEAENTRKAKAARANKAAEASAEAKRQAAREAAQIAQAEAAARTAEAEARAAARAAVRDAEREYQRSWERVDVNSETISKWVCDSAIDLEAERLIKETVDTVAVAVPAAAAKTKAVASPPTDHVHDWVEAAKNVQQTMREVADADIAAREAEDLDMAIAASLETAGASLPGESSSAASSAAPPTPSAPPPQFTKEPSRKQLRRLNQRPCWYFARGKCRYGDKCEYMHATSDANLVAPAPTAPAPVAPAPVAPDEHDLGTNTKCIICFEGDKDVVCLPCRHQCACSGCLDVVRRFGACPMCREPIVEAFSVFIA